MKKKKGFTLIEVLVVIAIIVLFSTLIFPQYHKGQKGLALQRATHQLSQDIRKAQEMALSAEICDGCGGDVPPGYGIFVDKINASATYILYADTNPAPGGNERYTGGDNIIETIDFEEGIFICDILRDGNPRDSGSINFKPPDPKVFLRTPGPPLSANEITIILGTDCLLDTKEVKANKAGLIYVE